MSEEETLVEYRGEKRVFHIDDGEDHHYAAKSAGEALVAHEDLMNPDEGSEFTVMEVRPGKVLKVRMEDAHDMAQFPAHWSRAGSAAVDDAQGQPLTIWATAAEWAWFYEEKEEPEQISSSVF